MTWVAHLVRTMTGERGAQLKLAASGTWSIPLNGLEDFTVTVDKAQLRGLEPKWWGHHRTSIAVSWRHEDGTLDAWVAGPIMGPPSETPSTATLTCKGIGAILSARVTLSRDYGMPGEYQGDMWQLAHANVTRTGMSLGSIAQDIVELSTTRKLGGFLPIRYGSPRETGSTLNQRTYYGYNLANNVTWKRLTELTGVRGGPDIAFRPAWTDDGMLEWVMVHGTRAQPAIEQAWTMDLDTTSSTSPVASTSVSTDASEVTNRVYWTGAGEGAGTLIRMVQDEPRLADHMPLLESVGSTSDSDSPDLLLSHAQAKLDDGRSSITQISVKIDGSDQRCEIGRWRVGDAALLTLGDEWLTVPAGTTTKRIIAAKGSWDSNLVDLEFQDDGPIEYEEEPDGSAP